MKWYHYIIILLIVASIIGGIYFLVKKIKDSIGDGLNNAADNIQNGAANTVVGSVLGFRTVQGTRAEEAIKQMNFMKNSWCVRANVKYNKLPYEIRPFFDTSYATSLAQTIKDANSSVPLGIRDDSGGALQALLLIESQVEAAQVTMAYYSYDHKDLGRSLGFLTNQDIIDAYNHLKGLPTGVWLNGSQLTSVTA